MLPLIAALFGFLQPFLPAFLQLGESVINQRFEIQRMRVQAEIFAQQHSMRMEEINTQADIAEMDSLRRPQVSFGIQIIDAWRGANMRWVWIAPVFYLFAFADWLAHMLRPTITYVLVGFYIAYRVACYYLLLDVAPDLTASQAITRLWTQDDLALVMYVLTFWFGQRSAKAFLGGSATNAQARR
jgi:hypothetical protein